MLLLLLPWQYQHTNLTQTDLSTSTVIMFAFAMMYFAAGLSWKIYCDINCRIPALLTFLVCTTGYRVSTETQNEGFFQY